MTDTSSASVSVHECSWADLQATLNIPGGKTVEVTDFEGFKWARKLDVGESRGLSGGRPKKRTKGSASYEGSATATRGGWMGLMEALEEAAVARGQVRGNEVIVSGIGFDLILQHTPLGEDRIYTTKMGGCRYLGDSSDMKQGNEADMIEIVTTPIVVATKSKSGRWLVIA